MPPTAVALALTLWEVLHRGPDLVDHTDELVAERMADPGVRHHPVVEVQVGAADRRELHADDRVVGVLDAGLVLLLDPQLVRAAIRHRAHGVSGGKGRGCRGSRPRPRGNAWLGD